MTSILDRARLAARRAAVGGFGAILALGSGGLVLGTATPAQACNMESYIGTVCAFSFNWCPRNWLPADGRLLTINSNQALYSLIGASYGGDARTTFALPDLRGRAVVNTGTGPGLPTQVFAVPSGVPTTALNVGNLPPHNHIANFTGVGGGTQTVVVPGQQGTLGVTAKLNVKDEIGQTNPATGSYLGKGPASGGGAASIYVTSSSQSPSVELGGLDVQLTGTPGNGPISFSYQSGITGGNVTIGNTGGGTQFSNQSPSLAMSYCIMVNGLYPDRP